MREMRAVEAEQAARRPQPKRKYPAKVSFYQERADTDRIRFVPIDEGEFERIQKREEAKRHGA